MHPAGRRAWRRRKLEGWETTRNQTLHSNPAQTKAHLGLDIPARVLESVLGFARDGPQMRAYPGTHGNFRIQTIAPDHWPVYVPQRPRRQTCLTPISSTR